MFGIETIKKLNNDAVKAYEEALAEQVAPPSRPRRTPLLELAPRLAQTVLDAADKIAEAFPASLDSTDGEARKARVTRLHEGAALLETAAHWARTCADRIEYSTKPDSQS